MQLPIISTNFPPQCVAQSGLSWTDVQACSESPEGDELQRSSEILTKTNTDGPTFVPSVTVNNDVSIEDNG